MKSSIHHSVLHSVLIGVFTLAGLSILPMDVQAQTVVTLDILNTPNNAGDIVVSKGTSVEVEFTVTGDSDKNDEIQLIRVDNNGVVSKKKRGNNETGTVNLDTNANNAIATLRVEYVQAGNTVASAPNQVVVVADEGSLLLSQQIADINVVDVAQGAQIGINTAGIATNATNITTNTTNIGLVTTEVSTNMTNISTLQGNVTTLQGDVTALEGGGGSLTGFTGGPTGNGTALGIRAYLNQTGNANTAIGSDALRNNTTGSNNTAIGSGAMTLNTTGPENVAVGYLALQLSNGSTNTAIGGQAMQKNTTGGANTAIGQGSLSKNTIGGSNTAAGVWALIENTTGDENTAIGRLTLNQNTTGRRNTALGIAALGNNTTGEQNTALGWAAGGNAITGSDNIYINNRGVEPESGTIRIGITSGVGVQTSAFIAGIRGVTTGVADGVPVVIDSNGQLGTISSSRRFKEDIQDMDAASLGLLQLRPVTFRYKEEYANGTKPLHYGLIAEEVAQVYPDLVVYGKDGQVETVQYQKLTTMLLNELQKEHQINQAQAIQLRAQQEQHRAMARQVTDLTTQLTQQNKALKTRLQQLEEQASAVSVRLH